MTRKKVGNGYRLTEEQKAEILRLRHAGVSLREVAKRVGCSRAAVCRWGTAEDRAKTAVKDRRDRASPAGRERAKRFNKISSQRRATRLRSLSRTLDRAAPDYTDPEFLEWLRRKAVTLRAGINWRSDNAEGKISTDWVYEKYLSGKCELSGRAFNWTKGHPCVPHVDRIDPEGGYVPENCRVILQTLNVRRTHYGNDDEAMMAAADESWFGAE